ncbi:MAG TPA: ERF family protein [Actinoplanes sp.]|nr:ERF family protein [Actinoplanes sp.]
MSAPREKDYPKTTAGCLVELMRRISAISKDQEMSEGRRFKFRGVDDVMAVVGPELRDLGLLCIPEMVHDESVQVEYGAQRKIGYRTRVHMRYRMIGPDASELVIGPVLGESIDGSDKGGSQAQSVAYRDMWLRALCVPTGEPEPEHSNLEPSRPEPGVSDPAVVAKLEQQIAEATTEAELRKAWKNAEAEYSGAKATITEADAQRLVATIRERSQAMEGARQ